MFLKTMTRVYMENSEEILEEISSVALLSPACIMNNDTKTLFSVLKRNNNW